MPIDKNEFLEDGESNRTKAWLSSQRQAMQTALHPHLDRATIERIVTDLLATSSMDVPLSARDRSLFCYRPTEQALPHCCWRNGQNGRLEVLASPTEDNGKQRTPYPLAISTDGERAAIGWRTDCRDEVDVEIVELESRRIIARALPPFESHRTTWDSELRGFWYVWPGPNGMQLLYQSILDPGAEPEMIQQSLPTERSQDICLMCFPESKWLLIAIRSSVSRFAFDYYTLSRNAGCQLRLLWPNFPHKASFCASGDHLFVLTNWDAPNMRVLCTSLADSGSNREEVLIPEGPCPIVSLHLAEDLLLLRTATTPWTTHLQAYSVNGEARELAGIPTGGTIESLQVAAGSRHVYLEESGMGRAPAIYRLDTHTGRANPYFRSHPKYSVPQVETITDWYTSFDGTRVPVRISKRKDLPIGKALPTMLTTYGGFGVIDTIRYTNRSTLWLSCGGVYVHAGVRGGGELGSKWHSDGKLHQKPNTFYDFIAAAEWLVAQGQTTPSRLAIVGGSNAGLVVGVAMTMRPDLFAAVICSGPLLDMLRYHKFAGGLIGVPEFGSPENPDDEPVLRGYSPYHNVLEGVDYPPVLFVSGDADTRCDPMHVRKMAARMQDANPSGRRVLLDYRPNKGHSGLMPVEDRIDSLTNQFVFLIDSLGLRIDQDGQFSYCRSDIVTPG